MSILKTTVKKSGSEVKQVTITSRMGDARTVSITGDFTDWSGQGIPLRRETGGIWQTSLSLAPGDYQYRLLVNGQWSDHLEAGERIPNPYGSKNCILRVR